MVFSLHASRHFFCCCWGETVQGLLYTLLWNDCFSSHPSFLFVWWLQFGASRITDGTGVTTLYQRHQGFYTQVQAQQPSSRLPLKSHHLCFRKIEFHFLHYSILLYWEQWFFEIPCSKLVTTKEAPKALPEFFTFIFHLWIWLLVYIR